LLFYTHLAWALGLSAFLGPDAWVTRELSQQYHREGYAWSHLWLTDSMAVIWPLHLAYMAIVLLFTLGLWTRVNSALAWLLAASYCHRLVGANFGLDQTLTMMLLYLAIGPSGSAYSLDRWLAGRRAKTALEPPRPTVMANVATRLWQIHLCIVYLFGGLGKMRGELWWDGSAMWYSVANLEYQSLDMTWLLHFPWLAALLSHLTMFWETFYCALVWPRLTRPLALGMAFLVHGGIAAFLGMITFGTAMILANMIFLPPWLVQAAVDQAFSRQGRAGEGEQKAAPRRKRTVAGRK
jgi:hypothetical protein